jgi:hypothetical protein
MKEGDRIHSQQPNSPRPLHGARLCCTSPTPRLRPVPLALGREAGARAGGTVKARGAAQRRDVIALVTARFVVKAQVPGHFGGASISRISSLLITNAILSFMYRSEIS